jgi:hypothetical protein
VANILDAAAALQQLLRTAREELQRSKGALVGFLDAAEFHAKLVQAGKVAPLTEEHALRLRGAWQQIGGILAEIGAASVDFQELAKRMQ